jgi:nucleolar protein 56
MYLITKWFGVFLCNKKEIIQKILFPKKEKEIFKRLEKIRNNEILSEEKKIIKKNKKDIVVNEKRLEKLGKYTTEDNFFSKIDIKPDDNGFSKKLIQKSSLLLSEKQTKETLKSIDLQVIQLINTLDEFIQTLNLLNERYESWSAIKSSEKRMKPLIKSISFIEKEIKTIEEQITKDMHKIAPNISNIIGPLVGARLISNARGLKRLALLPASTIQVLGAEKALFRFKKEGGKPPKHGVIFQDSQINKAPRKLRGKIARVIANKISIAARADTFTKRDISNELKKNINEQISEIRNL